MDHSYSVNAIKNGELVVIDYRGGVFTGFGPDWNQLMNAVALIAHGRNLENPRLLENGYRAALSETELWEEIKDSSELVFVDLSERVIYKSDKPLSAEELEKIPALDLVTILTRKQEVEDGGSFFYMGKILFETVDLFEYFKMQESSRIGDLLAVISKKDFENLYNYSEFNRLSGKKKRESSVKRAIDRFCSKNHEGALRLKADLCLGSDLNFSWDRSELEDCLKRLVDREYLIKNPILMWGRRKGPSVLEYADSCFYGQNGLDKNVPQAMAIYRTLYDEYWLRLQKYVGKDEIVLRERRYPGGESELGLFCQIAVIMGDLFGRAENADDLSRLYKAEVNDHDDDSRWNRSGDLCEEEEACEWSGGFLEDDAAGDDELSADTEWLSMLEKSGEMAEKYREHYPDSEPADDEEDAIEEDPGECAKRLCSLIAFDYYLKAYRVCKEFFYDNPIKEQYIDFLEDKMKALKEFL